MKVCVLGNSHIGALRRAWILEETPGFKLTFFGVGLEHLCRLKQDQDRIIPSSEVAKNAFLHTSGGLDAIKVSDYDAFLLVGAGFGLHTVSAEIFRQHRLSPYEGPDGAAIISEEFAVAALVDALARSTLIRMAKSVAAMTCAPVLLVPEPHPNRMITTQDTSWCWRSEQARALLRKAYRTGLRKIGRKIPIAPQPERTIKDHVFTAEKFNLKPGSRVQRMMSTGTARIPDAGDMIHMNSKYGTRVLRAAFDQLKFL